MYRWCLLSKVILIVLLTVILSNASVVSSIPLVWEGVLLPGLEYDCSPPIPPYRVGLLSRLKEIQHSMIQIKTAISFQRENSKCFKSERFTIISIKSYVGTLGTICFCETVRVHLMLGALQSVHVCNK